MTDCLFCDAGFPTKRLVPIKVTDQADGLEKMMLVSAEVYDKIYALAKAKRFSGNSKQRRKARRASRRR